MTQFLSTAQAQKRFSVGASFLKTARLGLRTRTRPAALTEGVHWMRVGGHVRYNADLLEDFFINQNSPDAHQRAIDAYLDALPSSQAAAQVDRQN